MISSLPFAPATDGDGLVIDGIEVKETQLATIEDLYLRGGRLNTNAIARQVQLPYKPVAECLRYLRQCEEERQEVSETTQKRIDQALKRSPDYVNFGSDHDGSAADPIVKHFDDLHGASGVAAHMFPWGADPDYFDLRAGRV